MQINDDGSVIMDNQGIAILTRVNDLAEGFGIKPYEFVATVRDNPKTGKTELAYETGDKHVAKKMEAMLDAIPAPDDMRAGALAGKPEDIIRALDQAITKAPRSRIQGGGRF